MTKINDEAIRLHGAVGSRKWHPGKCKPLVPITLALWMAVCAMAYLRG